MEEPSIRELFFKKLENIITIVGVIVAVLSTVIGIFLNDNIWVLGAAATVLAALTVAQLVANYANLESRKSIERIENHLKRQGKPLFTTRKGLDAVEPFQQFLAQGQDLLIAGMSLVGTVGPLRTFLRDLAERGIRLRFLLFDLESPFLEAAAQEHGVSPESLRADISASLNHIHHIKESVGESKRGFVQYRLLRTVPDTSIVMRNGDSNDGVIRCELYLYQTDTTGRPAFRITPSDGMVYQSIRDAAERLWSDSQN